jgi:hypothetical protein
LFVLLEVTTAGALRVTVRIGNQSGKFILAQQLADAILKFSPVSLLQSGGYVRAQKIPHSEVIATR